MSTYTVTAWDIRPSGKRTLVTTDVQASGTWEAQEAGWVRLGTAPGTWVVEIVDVQPATAA